MTATILLLVFVTSLVNCGLQLCSPALSIFKICSARRRLLRLSRRLFDLQHRPMPRCRLPNDVSFYHQIFYKRLLIILPQTKSLCSKSYQFLERSPTWTTVSKRKALLGYFCVFSAPYRPQNISRVVIADVQSKNLACLQFLLSKSVG